MSVRKLWNENDLLLIKEMYANAPMAEMVQLIGKKSIQISNKAFHLGLKRSAAFMKTAQSGRIGKGERIGIGTEFKKGLIPLNKGKKQTDFMSEEGIKKTIATRFKKGASPHNTVAIGFERVTKDGYVEVKVRESKTNSKNKNFELKQRIEYEKHHGPIPEGMIVEFVDRNKMNFEPSNLVLKTRRENMMANSFGDKAIVKRFMGVKEAEKVVQIIETFPELIELKRKSIHLKREIKDYDRKD